MVLRKGVLILMATKSFFLRYMGYHRCADGELDLHRQVVH